MSGPRLAIALLLAVWVGQSAGSGSISGRVVDHTSGAPIPGAIVRLTEVPEAAGVISPATVTTPLVPTRTPSAFLTTITDAEGKFAITKLPATTFEIDAVRPGWIRSGWEETTGRGPRWIPLDAAQRVASVDIRLPRTPKLSGRVVDASGAPISGMQVFAVSVSAAPATGPGGMAETDDRGQFRLLVAPGDYVVAAGGLPGISTTFPVPFAYPRVLYPAARTLADASRLRLQPGDDASGIDFALTLEPAFKVSVTVEGTSPASLGAGLELLPQGAGMISSAGSDYLPSTSGTFFGVTRGQYVVRKSGAVVGPAVSRAALEGLGPRLWTEQAISIVDQDVAVSLSLQPGASISGRVEFDGLIERPAQSVLAGASLTVEEASGAWTGGFGTYRDGDRFTTIKMKPGRYVVRPQSISDWRVLSVMLGGRDVSDAPIELGTADVNDLVIRFTDRRSGIAGRLMRDQPDDATRGVIAIFPFDRLLWRDYGLSSSRIKLLRAGRSGSFEVEVPPGNYYVAAVRSLPSTRLSAIDFELLAKTATAVLVLDGQMAPLSIRFPAGRMP